MAALDQLDGLGDFSHTREEGGKREQEGYLGSIYLTAHESLSSAARTEVIFRIKMESKFVKKCLMDETMT